MKIKNLHIRFLFLTSLFIYAVKPLKAQTEFGIKGGLLFSKINRNGGGMTFDFENRTGLAAGFFFKKQNLIGPVGFQTELLYQLKGSDVFIMHHCEDFYYSYGVNYGGFGYSDQRTVSWFRRPDKYHYLSLPLLITFSPFNFLDVYAGPELGYMIARSRNAFYLNDINQFSAGVTAGIGVKISGNTKLDLRYSEDFTPVLDFENSDIKNYSFTISLQRTLFRWSD